MARGKLFARDLGQPLVVRKDFKHSGRLMKAGDPFNWRKLSMHPRKVNQYLNAGLVAIEGDPRRDPNVASGKTPAKSRTSGGRLKEAVTPAVGKPSLRARAGGFYDVLNAEGSPVNTGALRKAAADALLATLMEQPAPAAPAAPAAPIPAPAAAAPAVPAPAAAPAPAPAAPKKAAKPPAGGQ